MILTLAEEIKNSGGGGEKKITETIKRAEICYLNRFNVGNWTAVTGSLLFTVKKKSKKKRRKMPFRHRNDLTIARRGEGRQDKKKKPE